jgi:hypothetical protein
MAAGAIPPPLFFERRHYMSIRCASIICFPRMAFSKEHPKKHQRRSRG